MKIFMLLLIVIFTVSCKEEKSLYPGAPDADYQKKESSRDTLNNLLKVANPTPGQAITSPLQIAGEARGYWFFEANAPVELLDGNLQTISENYTTALGEWMTTDWVQISGTITFEKPTTKNGFLIFHKANPSGLKEHDMSDTIPVKF